MTNKVATVDAQENIENAQIENIEDSQDGWRGEQNNTGQLVYKEHRKTYWRQ